MTTDLIKTLEGRKSKKIKREELTQDLLKELFDYRDGSLFWRVTRTGTARAGTLAGCTDQYGYRQINICGHKYLEHRLVWLFVNGVWPNGLLDHINRIENDNRIENLRESTHMQNCRNNSSKGVSFHKRDKQWNARIMVKRKSIHLGTFAKESDALKARACAVKKYFGEFGHINELTTADTKESKDEQLAL